MNDVNLVWSVRVSIPFDWAASKNHMFALRRDGHVALRGESRAYRDALTAAVRRAVAGQPVAQNKVWLDILVQKPNQRGDAANFVDMICDAVKDAIGVDDRWYSIRRLDWQIVKDNPRLFVGIGQEDCSSVQACSSCGRLLPFDAFHKNRGKAHGIGRTCRDCSAARPSRAKAAA